MQVAKQPATINEKFEIRNYSTKQTRAFISQIKKNFKQCLCRCRDYDTTRYDEIMLHFRYTTAAS